MQLEKEFGFAPDVLGKLLMARGLANSLSGVVWGSLADRLDRKRIMVASMMLAGIFTMLTPQLTTLQGFFATQMSIAFFAAAAVPVTQSLVSEKVEATDRGVAFASLAMCSGFSCSAAALLAGVLSWREAYRIMGAATISLALCLLVAFPAECRPASERTLEGALATEMEQLWTIFRIPTFRALLLGGVVGCIPWNALSFMMMFVEDLGFDSSHAAVVLAVMSVGRILGCLLGGILGDYMARVSPLHGRAFVAQLSIILGMAPLYWVLRCYSHSSRSPSSLASALFTFSLLATWCNPGVDRPLWSELVSPNCRGKIIAWWTAIAQSFGSVFAGPVVGYICVGVLGYQPGAEGSGGSRRANAESLGTAMAICTMLPWIVCFGCYSAIHATYPSDRHRADRISVGLGAKGAP
ncbi:gudP [Symbiodinium necroappetens]|uniref:GudP protein n=1 Tax=Symbiodinium necroappetens TaxID=1628268 RepID=A0A812TRJ6_9DINO|nr:gudP [Symbiodinium necroappetens]